MIEKERKFSLKYFPEEFLNTKQVIQQGYLMEDGNRLLRIRIIDDKYAVLCFKIYNGEFRYEYEYNVSLDEAKHLMNNAKCKLIKDRYSIDNISIDVYPEPIGESVVEIEYEDELVDIPDFCGENLSGKPEYSNYNIAKKFSNF